MEFEWNLDKAKLNLEKHGICCHETSTDFSDSLPVTFPNPDHSIGENHYVTIDISRLEQLLVVAHNRLEKKGPID